MAKATKLVDAKYGRLYMNDPSVSVERDADDPDEPCFVIRAQDDLAVHILTRYRNAMGSIEDISKQPTHDYMEALDAVIASFTQFRQEHADRIKIAD